MARTRTATTKVTQLALLSALSFACATPTPLHAETPRTTSAETRDGRHDFDFMFGTWSIQVRRLRHPLTGSSEWYEMTGTTECHPFMNGQANIEEGSLNGPDGHVQGVMVRLYSPTAHQWALNWVTDKTGRFEIPTIGEFKDGRGEFYDQEMFEGRMILVRFLWSDTQTARPHFQQSFSSDGGKTWELNWDSYVAKVSR